MQQQSQDIDAGHLAALRWYANRIENVSIQAYVGDAGSERYDRIGGILEDALEEIVGIGAMGTYCPDGYCPDEENEMCEPCPQGRGPLAE